MLIIIIIIIIIIIKTFSLRFVLEVINRTSIVYHFKNKRKTKMDCKLFYTCMSSTVV